MNIVMIAVLAVIFLAEAALYLLSKGKYDDYIEPLDKKTYQLKQLYPVGLYILDKIHYKYSNKYDKNLMSKIIDINGYKYAQFYLQIHYANKIVYLLLSLLFLAFVGANIGADTSFIAFSLLLLVLIFYITDRDLTEKIKKRRTSIQIEFPDFLNKLTLLINAGMTVYRAWEKISDDNNKESLLYEELANVIAEIKAGTPEIVAYENFAKKCRIPEVTKFISVIVQNSKKGSTEVVPVLRLQSVECWEMRKNAAKQIGEEASTKMLFPMMIMLLAILLIVATPAVLAMRM